MKSKIKKLFIFLSTVVMLFGCGNGKLDKSDPKTYTTIGQGPVAITVVNQSLYPNEKLEPIVNAVNIQLSRDVKVVWGIDSQIKLGNSGDRVLYIKNDLSEFPNAWHLCTGFHTTGSLGYVDINECENDTVVSVTISHEILEMLSNPNSQVNGYEICDAVNPRSCGYLIDSVTVSDFVYPNFYVQGSSGPWDQTRNIQAPLRPVPGSQVFATVLR